MCDHPSLAFSNMTDVNIAYIKSDEATVVMIKPLAIWIYFPLREVHYYIT